MDVKKERNTGEIAHQAALLLWPGYDLGTCIASACSGYEWTLGAVGVIPGGKLAVTGVKLLGRAWRAKRIAATGLPDNALVVRGGNEANQAAAKINSAIGPSRTPEVEGFSAQCNGGTCLPTLAGVLKNNQVGVTTAGDIRKAGVM